MISITPVTTLFGKQVLLLFFLLLFLFLVFFHPKLYSVCVETEAMEYNLPQVLKLANDKMNFID